MDEEFYDPDCSACARAQEDYAALERITDDLAALVQRLARNLRKAEPASDLPDQATDYLRRKGLLGSPLRARQTESNVTTDLSALFQLPPEKAIAYLEAKGNKFTWNWWEMQREAHAQAFTVAKLARLDILQDIRGAVETALAEGRTERWFRQELEQTLKRSCWRGGAGRD